MKLDKNKIIAIVTPIITLAAGYFGYQPIQELTSQPDVNIEVITPEHTEQHVHAPMSHEHKEFNALAKDIRANKARIDEAVKQHENRWH